MCKKIFLDANILMDFIDAKRAEHLVAKEIILKALNDEDELFTSCDIVTTIYYLSTKANKLNALDKIMNVNSFCKIIEFSNNAIEKICTLMLQNRDFKDLEDTIQYVLAKSYDCDFIITNDKNFHSPDIELFSSQQFINHRR